VRDAEFSFATAATPVAQRRGYLRMLLSHRVSAGELRAFDMARELTRRHDQDDAAYLGLLRGHVRRRQGYALLTVAAASLALTAALLAIVALLDAGRITLPEAGAAAIAARLLGGQLSTVFRSVGSLVESGPFLRDLEQFLAAFPARPSQGALRDLRSQVRATGVSFTYPGRDRPALDDVTVVVPRGGVVALVGENGSGKTTLAKVVAGLYSPEAGAVCWDGEPAAADDLRASVTVLFQDFLRYQMSVEDNVVLSDSSRPADPSRARRAADRVGIGEVVDGLPRGMSTVLGLELEDGTDLSGGQWQRLALARALYRDAPLVVLDEPTAAMDPRAEHELFADVRTVLDGRSALLVSHRYSSVRLADHIYVMAGGRVVEEGTHEQLVAHGGQYAELYALQAAAYLEQGTR
jgi:ATP-binding cassette subfamily B protein